MQLAFDQWLLSEACEHEFETLLSHRIGNIALVAALRAELQRVPDRFPILLARVLYDGTHCGDFIPALDVPKLIPEVEALAAIHCSDASMEPFMRAFEAQMRELVEAALRVDKPIVF